MPRGACGRRRALKVDSHRAKAEKSIKRLQRVLMDENEEHASDGDPPRDESSDHEIRGVSSKPPFREKTAQEGKEAKPATSEGYDRGRIFSFVEIGLTVVLVGVAAFQAWIYSQQLNIMTAQRGILDKQTSIMDQQTDISARPWVGFDGVTINTFDVASNPQETAKYAIRNFGNGPAFNVSSAVEFISDDKMFQASADHICSVAAATITGSTLLRDQSRIEPPRAWLTDIPNPKKIEHFWFLGCVTYRDQRNKSHWTRLCQLSDPAITNPNKDTALYSCAEYNDTDKDD